MDLKVITKNIPLNSNEKRILKYIINNIKEIEGKTLKELSKEVYSSPATIVRLSKKLGYTGYLDLYYFIFHHCNRQDISNPNLQSDTMSPFSITEVDFSQDVKENIAAFHKLINDQPHIPIVICATGFSGNVSTYLYKKLLVKGVHVIYSGGEDSSGIIERNIDRLGLFIGISKSGETTTIIDKTNLCHQHQIPTFVITGNQTSALYKLGKYTILVRDDAPYDSQNITYNNFFIRLLFLFELLSDF
ncbi:MurR/RpiR family transcriptional regulator [Ignavigranum ruoffiae]|uniref:MurR/RpiR family transcriptional regulator n=1 Tax=Ignavigranum ruoffiae TaxID=89093 RepID=UPI0024AC89BF|nr:MurR/RpiR family transcriptional regulator [Ignavigranum ruoffiae]